METEIDLGDGLPDEVRLGEGFLAFELLIHDDD